MWEQQWGVLPRQEFGPPRSLSQRECLGVGLGTPALTLSQIRTGQREARGPGGAEKSREQRFSPHLRQVKGKGGRKWVLLGGDGSGGHCVMQAPPAP